MVRWHLKTDRLASARGVFAVALAVVFALTSKPSAAQSPLPGGLPPPPGMSMPDYAKHRFPQPVRVGTLVGEAVQRPVESHERLGTVRAIVRRPDGTLTAVIRYGDRFGIGGRDIAVPLDAMALLGPLVEIVGFTPRELDRFPRFVPNSAMVLSGDTVVRVGLAKPPH